MKKKEEIRTFLQGITNLQELLTFVCVPQRMRAYSNVAIGIRRG